jgi:hypothetical protein
VRRVPDLEPVLVLAAPANDLLDELQECSHDHSHIPVVIFYSACGLVTDQAAREKEEVMPRATQLCTRYSRSRHARLEVGRGQQVLIAAVCLAM